MTDSASNYKNHLHNCFINAQLEISKLSEDILNMEGMSGIRTRHFYNNLLSLNDARYLEIGTWKGSSVCSAMYGHSATVVCMDNWTQFDGPKDEFLTNFNKYKGDNKASFIEADCFTFDAKTLPKFNIYLYDGPHKEDEHYRALTQYIDAMDNTFIYICDDWNWPFVRSGTYHAITTLGLKIEYEFDYRTTTNDEHVQWHSNEQRQWHNGIYMAVLSKPTTKPI